MDTLTILRPNSKSQPESVWVLSCDSPKYNPGSGYFTTDDMMVLTRSEPHMLPVHHLGAKHHISSSQVRKSKSPTLSAAPTRPVCCLLGHGIHESSRSLLSIVRTGSHSNLSLSCHFTGHSHHHYNLILNLTWQKLKFPAIEKRGVWNDSIQ